MPIPATLILILFTFGSSIFYVLLALERRVWIGSLTFGGTAGGSEADVRLVHRTLKHLIPVLPPSNGVVVVGGLTALLWQCVARGFDPASLAILAYYLAGQSYIILAGRIVAAVRDVWITPSDGDLEDVRRGVWNLVRQHRNGLIHAAGIVALELSLIVFQSP